MRKSLLLLILFASSSLAWAQERTITGKVTAATTGETLPGVTILVKGTSVGVNTNIDGTYKLSVPNDATTLVYSFIGYLPEEIIIGNQSAIDVVLFEDIQQLDEIIVVGYGTQKKSVATASVSKVDQAKLKGFAAPRVDQMLQGQVAGVIFKSPSGQPGSATNIFIRGIGTNGNNNPLIIMDGLVVGDGALSNLNPDDIENIQVLKDGASTAIYGARAANGIIMVTTKKAKSGEAQFNYSFNAGVQEAWRLPKLMNAAEYEAAIREKYQNGGLAVPLQLDSLSALGNDTNWMEELFGQGKTQSHQISVSKGTETGSLFSSISYWDQTGLIAPEKSYIKRITARLNYEQKVNSFITVGQNLFYTHQDGSKIGENSEFGTSLGDALVYDPLTPIKDPSKLFGFAQSPLVKKEYLNPFSRIFIGNGFFNRNEITGNAYVKLALIKGLTFKSDIGFTKGSSRNSGFTPTYVGLTSDYPNNPENDISENLDENFRWQLENYFSYQKSLGNHFAEITLGTTAQEVKYSGFGASASNIPIEVEFDENFRFINDFLPDSSKMSYSYGSVPEKLASVFGRIIYNYQEKYLASFTLRRDGSSKFGPNNRYGVFPSASLGWVISREQFFNVEPISMLKVRASYGINGNDRIDNLQYASRIGVTGIYPFGRPDNHTLYTGQSSVAIPDPNIRWEQSKQFDIGVEISLFGNALTAEIDYFHKTTSDLLMVKTIPIYAGNKPPISNVGEVVNKGFELELNYQQSIGDFKYSVGLNASTLKNEVTKVSDDGYINGYGWPVRGDIITRMEVGRPIGFFRGYASDGIFKSETDVDAHIADNGNVLQPNAKPGDIKYLDTNGDGIISDLDITQIGKPWADLMMGLNLSVAYKSFDARVLFSANIGNDVFRSFERTDVINNNYTAEWNDRWSETNPDGDYPRLTSNDTNLNTRPSNFYVEDASFLRIKTLQIGYNAPLKWLKYAKMSNLRIYVSSDNLATITGYSGFDPEIGSSGWILDSGIDKGFYPLARTFSFGVNLSF